MSRTIVSLALLLTVAFVVHFLAGQNTAVADAALMRTAMSVGLLMIGAWLTGILFESISLPRISGYLIFGVLVGPAVAGLIPLDQVRGEEPTLAFISDLAIALIALTAGGEIRINWIRSQLGRVSTITCIELAAVWIVVGTAVFIAEQFVPFIHNAPLDQRIVLAVLTGLVAAANSPAVVIAMINEHRAEGTLAKTTLAVTIFKDMLMVVLFASTLAIGKGVADENTAISGGFLLAVAMQLIGSIVLGGLLGVVMAWYVHRVGEHLVFFVIGSCMLLAIIGEQTFSIGGNKAHLEPLLLGLSAGIVMQNLWPKRSEPLFETIESMSLPIYCLFFALAGAKIDLQVLMAPAAAALIAALFVIRVAAIWGSVTVGAKLTGIEPPARGRLWLGFVPQAGIALALAQLIEGAFSAEQNVRVESILIGLIAINELIGPVGFRHALLSSGESRETQHKTDQAPQQSPT